MKVQGSSHLGIYLRRLMLCGAALFVLFSATGILSCGRVERVSGKELHEFDTDAYPTLANFSRWEPKWEKNGWIVSFADSPDLSPQAAAFTKTAAIRSLLFTGGLQEGTEAFQSAGSFLNTNLHVELIRMNHFWNESTKDDPALGFYYIKLNNPEGLWDTISSTVDLPPEFTGAERSEAMAAWQSGSLASLDGVKWVEPNLMSELSSDPAPSAPPAVPAPEAVWTPPPEFKTSAPIVEVLKRIKADQAYKYVFDSGLQQSDVTVAVLDTGVDFLHPDLKDQMANNPGEVAGDKIDNDGNCHIDDVFGIDATVECSNDSSADPKPGPADLGGPGVPCPAEHEGDDLSHNCGHGSHVAGIIAAKQGGQLNTVGVCPHCKILSLRVAERCLQPDTGQKGECVKVTAPLNKTTQYEVDGGIADASQIRALSYIFKLRRPAPLSSQLVVNVVNMSLGKYFRSRAMSYIIRNLDKKGVIVVAAAGNDNTDSPSYPAAYAPVVAVCATGEEEYHRGQYGKAIFSNFGDWVDICAPGVDIESTIPGTRGDFSGQKIGLTTRKDGTSQATPFVAGSLGYLLSVSGEKKSAKQLIRELKEAANYDDLYNAKFNKGFYEACYPDHSACDALLGSGFLDLLNAVKAVKKSRVSETDPKAVTSGCVVSTIGRGLPFFGWHFFTGMPFLMANFWLVLKFLSFFQRRNIGASKH